jgi:hypothetical protein
VLALAHGPASGPNACLCLLTRLVAFHWRRRSDEQVVAAAADLCGAPQTQPHRLPGPLPSKRQLVQPGQAELAKVSVLVAARGFAVIFVLLAHLSAHNFGWRWGGGAFACSNVVGSTSLEPPEELALTIMVRDLLVRVVV